MGLSLHLRHAGARLLLASASQDKYIRVWAVRSLPEAGQEAALHGDAGTSTTGNAIAALTR